mmetsp:Transcript_5816/g.6318  ORF Transcript_5816/g.6318 Transcript_5816/m.6318 type:complete len:266 (+) Transcript_5816:40-837(+)
MERLTVKISNNIAEVILDRPKKLNLMDHKLFMEIRSTFDTLADDINVRAIVLHANGKLFCAGLDLAAATSDMGAFGIRKHQLYTHILNWQAAVSSIEKCKKPVIAAIHGACIGGAVDVICAADFRVCTKDAYFSIKETAIAMVADLGTLQRIQKVVPKGLAREMAFTAAPLKSGRALSSGFVNQVYENKEDMLKGALKICTVIASHSPLAVQGTKIVMNYAQEHTTEDGLNHIAMWNTTHLMSDDLTEASMAFFQKRKPVFKCNL